MSLKKHGINDQKLVSFGGRPNRGEEENERRREEEEEEEEKKKKKRKRKRRRREEKRKVKPKRYGTLYTFVWNY